MTTSALPLASLPRRLHKLGSSEVTPSSLSLLSWNLLADGLAQHGSFCRTPSWALEWEHRRGLILAELARSDADILCCCEVNHFEDLDAALQSVGFAPGAFAAKRDSPCVALGFPGDGLALWCRATRFQPLAEASSGMYCDAQGNCFSQCYLLQRLLDLRTGRPLLVATTHLKAKESELYDQVRLLEAQQLLAAVERERLSPDEAVLICGDFNTLLSSPACRAMSDSRMGLQVTQRDVPDEVAFTTWKFRAAAPKNEKCAVIDHVWHSAALQQVATWAQLSRAECGPDALPSSACPSDHLAQFNVFNWR